MPYEDYFKAATEALLIIDRGGQILELNPKAAEIFGYGLEELVGKSVELLLPERFRHRHIEHRQRYIAAPCSRPMGLGLDLIGRRKDGSEFFIEVSLTYARGTERGDLVVAAIADISERIELEHEARRAETLASLGTIAAGIAHDLNNPLSIILSRSELLLTGDGSPLPESVREDISVMHSHARRASRIVEEFLQLARPSPRISSSVDLNDLVKRGLLLLGEQMRRSRIEIVSLLEERLPRMLGDAISLERVVINLLTNARDAMPDGGVVSIETGIASENPPLLCLTVTDTGKGIPPEALGKVFDLLYTTKSHGTGLGLWLSRRIVQEHKGKITVRSDQGRGATFIVTLPAADMDKSNP
jgi:PAS domain S-box-containing protein